MDRDVVGFGHGPWSVAHWTTVILYWIILCVSVMLPLSDPSVGLITLQQAMKLAPEFRNPSLLAVVCHWIAVVCLYSVSSLETSHFSNQALCLGAHC